MIRLSPVDRGHRYVLLALGTALLAGCAMPHQEASTPAGTYEGPPVAIGQGQARTFVMLDEQGQAKTLGIRLSEAALSGLPTDGEREYLLSLPPQAAGTGYDHVAVDWNPHGHIPPGIYDKPHFDFHFYVIDAEQRNAITVVGEDLERARKAPEPAHMPADYVLPPGTEVPRMGAHAIDPGSDEFQEKPFTQTFIYGFYDGRTIFVEPMMTLEFLASRPDVSTPVKQPEIHDPAFAYPTSYGVRYDTANAQYEITLEGLVRH
ncbi:hypothetical protein CGX12_09530 [Zobellella denitrificans]|uniref:DUF5602 domain-containing protein n=1 Tax=Zobellella denitrificans TaxID=347534 RepID=UPI000B8C3006|nr:DUF5602 domain-containing protein [Zobellella denitrificans]OXS15343.1 hypothetical protein CGX12_09530 [Zobellella denitrificans]